MEEMMILFSKLEPGWHFLSCSLRFERKGTGEGKSREEHRLHKDSMRGSKRGIHWLGRDCVQWKKKNENEKREKRHGETPHPQRTLMDEAFIMRCFIDRWSPGKYGKNVRHGILESIRLIVSRNAPPNGTFSWRNLPNSGLILGVFLTIVRKI